MDSIKKKQNTKGYVHCMSKWLFLVSRHKNSLSNTWVPNRSVLIHCIFVSPFPGTETVLVILKPVLLHSELTLPIECQNLTQ